MSIERRASVEGWRWDFLTPWGWLPSSGVMNHYRAPGAGEPQGWYIKERAICLYEDHHAPNVGCVCGLHGIEHLSEAVATRLEQLDVQRIETIEDWVRQAQGVPIAGGSIPPGDVIVIALSRATFEDVLPTAWPDDAEALAAHPDAVADPPDTIRGHRKQYREIFVDREWPVLHWPEEIMPEHGVHHVPNLATWVREQNNKE